MEIKKILIALDDSDYSMKAAKKAVEFSKTFKAEIAVVFVMEAVRPVVASELGYVSTDALATAKEEADEVLDKLEKGSGVEMKKYMPQGNPWEEIIKVAGEFGADLISLSTHGRTGVIHLLLGSVAESVVQHSKVPVLIYPANCL